MKTLLLALTATLLLASPFHANAGALLKVETLAVCGDYELIRETVGAQTPDGSIQETESYTLAHLRSDWETPLNHIEYNDLDLYQADLRGLMKIEISRGFEITVTGLKMVYRAQIGLVGENHPSISCVAK